MIAPPAYPSNVMTVIIRDDSPMVNCGDSPSYRTVRIELTPEQVKKLALYATHGGSGYHYHEDISRVIIEREISEAASSR